MAATSHVMAATKRGYVQLVARSIFRPSKSFVKIYAFAMEQLDYAASAKRDS